jgi:hypothetical protein
MVTASTCRLNFVIDPATEGVDPVAEGSDPAAEEVDPDRQVRGWVAHVFPLLAPPGWRDRLAVGL